MDGFFNAECLKAVRQILSCKILNKINGLNVEKQWILKDAPDPLLVDKLMQETPYSEAIVQLLINRGHLSYDTMDSFLDPDKDCFHDPFLLKDMDKAADRIIEALVNKQNILVWGDYDVDGITSTSLMYLFLHSLGGNVFYKIPSREFDGYGMSESGIEELIQKKINLIVTVDCGITSIEQAKYASKHNIDIVITDHHEPGNELPDVYAVVDPKRPDCTYPYKHLAGVGVAFKLIQAILINCDMPPEDAYEFLDLATIGTVADIVPLSGENRKIVYEGLKKLRKNPKIGIQALFSQLQLDCQNIKVSNILFGMAPRINAAGRMGDAERAVKLLISSVEHEAVAIVSDLEMENNRRKDFDQHTLAEAIQINEVENGYNPDHDKVVVVGKDGWHVGVIGIVASRMVEKYHRPCVVISIDNGVGKGSCRSIPGLNIYGSLLECSDLLKQFGGHEYAAGLEIESANIPIFRETFNRIVSQHANINGLIPTVEIELNIGFEIIDDELISYLQLFEPFGPDNKQPVFATDNVEVVGVVRKVGANHLRMKLKHNDYFFDAIAFNMADKYQLVEQNRSGISIAYNIEENSWNNNTYIQLKIKDIKI